MQNFLRISLYVLRYRKLVVLSVVCALIVSAFWALNLSIAFPVVKVLFQNDSLHEFVDAEIATRQTTISELSDSLEQVPEIDVKRRARLQYLMGEESRHVLLLTRIRNSVLPWVPHDRFDTMAVILGVLLLATVIKGLFIYFQELLVGSIVQLTVNAIRQDCFRAALRLDVQSLSRIGTSSLMSGMTNDIEQMTQAIRVFGVTLVREPLKACACTALAFFVNWRLALLSITMVPLLGLVFSFFGKRLRRASHRTMESMAKIYECISETFGAARIVIAFSGFRKHRRQFLKANREYYAGSMKIVMLGALSRPISETMGVLGVFAALAPGAYLVLRETDTILGIQLAAEPMSIAELATLYALLAGTLDPVRKLSSVFEQIKRGMAGCERVFGLIDRRTTVPEPAAPRMLIPHNSLITFRNISFRYDTLEMEGTVRPLALKNVSLDVRFGEVIAVVGGNGSGKSTLLSLLPRFMDPDEGQILIDGVDIREFRTADLRSQIGLVTQETFLFNDTIYENIRYGNPTATTEMIQQAAEKAQASGFIQQLPDGYQTIVGEKGGKLSGGQRQRIALARAIVRNPSILILDEATSAVDSHSEDVIHTVLKDFAVGRTVFIITHSLSSAFLDLVDRIAVLDQGQIRAVGTLSELQQNAPATLHMLQPEIVHSRAA
ncbi:ABC transporter ATP-binding protein [Planctomycetia bacterium]|nr:ABC transporter ATP-binding protein [Planctomycetia bacterium]